ncbi:MAG TPA: NADP-dependent oxidoreductase [Sphingobium sp.]
MTVDDQSGRRVVLKNHPDGALRASDFAVEQGPVPTPGEGEFLVRNLIVSVDPMLRLFVDAAPLGGNLPPLPVGATIPGAAVGEVIASRHPDYRPGDLVEGRFGWQDYALSDGAGANRVDPAIGPAENALGIGGLPGFTAYVGLDVAQVQPGQTVLVSGAAGAVGSVVGPLVRARGARAVGIAGGAEKRRYLTDQAGYDAAVDRHAPDFLAQLKATLPDGADVYFDNVGGPMLLDLLPFLKRGALVLVCGLMAQYQGKSDEGGDRLPALLEAIMSKRLRIQSFSQYGQDALRPAFHAQIADMLASGALAATTRVEQGLERLPEALAGLFTNSVSGKVVVRIAEPGLAATTAKRTENI